MTLLEKILEVFPDIELDRQNTPKYICPSSLGFEDYKDCCWGIKACEKCWSQVYTEPKKDNEYLRTIINAKNKTIEEMRTHITKSCLTCANFKENNTSCSRCLAHGYMIGWVCRW